MRDLIAVFTQLTKEPITYINLTAIFTSFTDVELFFKLFLYSVSIIASILVSVKYLIEIKKLRKLGED